jgi:nucleotide-binding universal stress UspA family protein
VTVVLGYDESPGADRALETAVTVAHKLGEPLVLVYGAAPPGRSGAEFQSHLAALEALGQHAVAHAYEIATARGVETSVEVLPEKPTEALLDVAERHDATLIVVGSYGESPLKGALLGSTPHRLLHLSTRPVLVVPE